MANRIKRMEIVLSVLIGFVLLLAGRKLFWLFVGVAGFLYGLELTPRLWPDQPQVLVLGIALVLGLLGTLLAVFLQKLAIGLAGALFGGYLFTNLAHAFGFDIAAFELPLFIAGAILGAILMIAVFDWALIILSSLIGALLVIQPFELGGVAGGVLFLAVAIAGMLVQGTTFLRAPAAASEH